MDIAQLGISVDSRQVKTATGDLGGMVKAAGGAESATKQLTSAVSGLAAAFGGLSIASVGLQAMRDFSREMAGLQAVTRASTADMAKLADQARLLGAATQYGAGEAASAQRALAQAGLNTNQVLGATANVLALAQAGQLQLAESADLAANVMAQFNLSAQQTGMIADVLVKTGDKATTSVGELGEAFKYAGPLASSLGVSLQDTSAALGIISNSGIKASSAGTGLLGVFRQLSNVSNEAAGILQSYGVAVSDVDIATKGLIPVIELLASKNIAAGDAVKIFGSESVGAALALLKAGENVRAFSTDLQNATGAAQQNADIMANNLDAAVKGIGGAFEGLVLSVKGTDGALKDAANTVTGVINSFSGVNDELVKAGQMSAGAAAGYQQVADVLTLLAGVLVGRVVGGYAAATAARIADIAASRAALTATAQEAASTLALETRLKALALQELATARARGVDTVAAANAAAAATARYNAAVVAADAAHKAASVSAGLMRGALALLGGPIGAVTTLLTIGVTAWITWGNSGGKAIDDLNAKLREHNRLKANMGSGELADYRAGYAAANEQLKQLLANRDRLMARGEHTGGIDAEIQQLRNTMVQAKGRIAEITTELQKQQAATAALTTETKKSAAVQNSFLTEQQQKLAEVAALKQKFADEEKRGNFDAETRASRAVALQEQINAIMSRGAKTRDTAGKAAIRIAEQQADAYGDLERSLSKQLMTEQELTTEQRVSMDLADKRYKNLSDDQKSHLIAMAKEVDAFKAQQKLLGEIATAAQALSDSITKSQQAEIDAAYAAAKATEDQLAKLQEEADTYGMTESQIQQYLLAKAEEKLALEQGGDARQGVIDQIEREIEARRKLVSVAQGGEARKAADDMGGAVQKSLADAVKAGLEASNPIKGFAQSLGNAVKNALYNAVAQGLATRLSTGLASVVGLGGASGAAVASEGGGADAGSLLGLLGSATGGNSIGTALANGALGGEFGIFANAGNVSNLALAGYGLAGGLFGNLIGAGKSGSMGGSLGASAGALIGGPLGALAGGLAGSVLGGVLGGAWKGGGGQKFGGEGAIGRATAGLFPEGQTDAQVQSALDTFGTGVQDIVKKLGGSLSGLQYAYGYETDPQGTAGNFFSSQLSVGGQMLRNINVQQYTGEASDQMAKEFKTATVLALQKANLSADLQTAFDGFDPAIEGAADKVLARLEQIKAVGDAFDQLGKIMPNLAGLSLEAKESLLALAGGSEQLASGLASYYQTYYTEAERTQQATKQLAEQFAGLGVAVPESAEAFRQLVESQDLSTESGRKLYAQLIGLSGAFAESVSDVDALGDVLPQLASLSREAKESLIALAGGVDNLSAQWHAYYETFYTDSERAGMAAVKLSQQFAALGVEMPQTEAAFRVLVESQDKTTESGRNLYVQLLGLSGAFADTARAAKAAAASMVDAALATLQQSIDSEKTAASGAANALIESYRDQIEAATAAAKATVESARGQIAAINEAARIRERDERNQLASIAKVESNILAFYDKRVEAAKAQAAELKKAAAAQEKAQDAVVRAMEQRVSELQSIYDILADTLRSTADFSFDDGLKFIADSIAAGGVTDKDQLQQAVEAVKAIDENGYTTRLALDRAKAAASADMTRLQSIVGQQLSQGNSQLATEQAQLAAIQALPDVIQSELDDVIARYDRLAEQIKKNADEQSAEVKSASEKAALQAAAQISALENLIDEAELSRDAIVARLEDQIEMQQGMLSQELSRLDALYGQQVAIAEAAMGTTRAVLSLDESIKALASAIQSAKTATIVQDNSATKLEQGYAAQIGQLYREIFKRDPDETGLAFYVKQAMAGVPMEQIRADLQYAALHGSHKNGLAEVPFDGYRAELHAGERVLTAQQADSSDKMAIDLAEMKAEMKAALYAIADNTRRVARMQERWDGDGLPDARGY